MFEVPSLNFSLPNYEIMESFFKTQSLFNLILKWKFHLAGFVILAGILAIIFSSDFFIKPKYESSAVIYPSGMKSFSDESETEQMLEIISSNDIMFKLIETFDLPKHYDIDREQKQYIHKIVKAFQGNVSFKKTANEAVEIVVRDENPQIASDMVDSIISFYNEKVLNINKLKSAELVVIYKNEMIKRNAEIDSLSSVITRLRKEYGILHMPAQVEKFTEAIYLGKSLNEAREVLGGWKEMGSEYQKTDSLFFYAIADYCMPN